MSRALAILLALALAPLAAALPGVCEDPCVIASSSARGYEPVAALVANGASVVWTTSDYTHVTANGRGFLDGPDHCVEVIHDVDEPSPAVRFDLVGGVLYATTDGETRECQNVVATPAGAAVPYYCVLHPTMRGVLTIVG